MPEIQCLVCPLRQLPMFLSNNEDEIALIQSLKQREVRLKSGEMMVDEGHSDARLFTLRSGWAFRYKTLSDGRRQILNFLLPGDFVGLQQSMLNKVPASHGVMAITDVELCIFRRSTLRDLNQRSTSLGFHVTWLAAHEAWVSDEKQLTVGRRTATERIALLLVRLFDRAAARQKAPVTEGVAFPLSQQHIADALGLSLVHTNKTLRKLERQGLHRLENGRLFLHDRAALEMAADFYGYGTHSAAPSRPLI